MPFEQQPNAAAWIQRAEKIVQEIKLWNDGTYGGDYFASEARSLLLDLLEHDSLNTWEELRQSIQQRASFDTTRDGSLALLTAIGPDRCGPMPK